MRDNVNTCVLYQCFILLLCFSPLRMSSLFVLSLYELLFNDENAYALMMNYVLNAFQVHVT